MRSKFISATLLVLSLLGMIAPNSSLGQGSYVSSAGPIHRGMGGASTAAPMSALGAMYWNPATISGLYHSELEVGLDFLSTEHRVSSTIGPFSGTTEGDAGVFPLPNVGWVYHTQNPALTFGLGINAVAGFKTNLPSDLSNPILAPQAFGGLGRVSSEASFLQIAPVLSYACSDQVSVAVGPVITSAQVGVEPFILDSANPDGTYPSGRATRYHWGGGFQAGIYYVHNACWQFGSSFKSKAWMEEFDFFGEDQNGLPRTLHADIDLPMVVSWGIAHTGFEDVVLALDARFMDYQNADGFGTPATFDSTGRLAGLDWSSIFVLALGGQKKVSDRIIVRAGYTYNQNPIRDSEAFFNVASPLIYEHVLSLGGSFQLNPHLALSAAYSHYFQNDRIGPVVLPGIGAVPGSSVVNEMQADFLSFGIVMRH